jgi:hypothetical protein
VEAETNQGDGRKVQQGTTRGCMGEFSPCGALAQIVNTANLSLLNRKTLAHCWDGDYIQTSIKERTGTDLR